MKNHQWQHIHSFDNRRDVIVPGDYKETIAYCVKHFIAVARHAITTQGYFAVALSGGSTPKAIYEALTPESIDWKKALVFWSDERSVPPTHPDSNYKMALEAGFQTFGIPSDQIFRMHAEQEDIEKAAKDYETLIKERIPKKVFDLVMLGMGEDGHTASLFPRTHGLHTKDRLVIANFVPQKETWRMSLTFDCINHADSIALYVLGAGKAAVLTHALAGPYDPDEFPVQKVGTPTHKALWIADNAAAAQFVSTSL